MVFPNFSREPGREKLNCQLTIRLTRFERPASRIFWKMPAHLKPPIPGPPKSTARNCSISVGQHSTQSCLPVSGFCRSQRLSELISEDTEINEIRARYYIPENGWLFMVEPSPTGSKNLLPNRQREWEWERRAG